MGQFRREVWANTNWLANLGHGQPFGQTTAGVSWDILGGWGSAQ